MVIILVLCCTKSSRVGCSPGSVLGRHNPQKWLSFGRRQHRGPGTPALEHGVAIRTIFQGAFSRRAAVLQPTPFQGHPRPARADLVPTRSSSRRGPKTGPRRRADSLSYGAVSHARQGDIIRQLARARPAGQDEVDAITEAIRRTMLDLPRTLHRLDRLPHCCPT